jgi:hypothetical protein
VNKRQAKKAFKKKYGVSYKECKNPQRILAEIVEMLRVEIEQTGTEQLKEYLQQAEEIEQSLGGKGN